MFNTPTNTSLIWIFIILGISSLSLLLSIFLLILIITLILKQYSHIMFLKLQFLLGTTLCNIYLILHSLHLYNNFIQCLIISSLRSYSTFPVITSAIFIAFIHLVIIKKYIISSHKLFVILFFSISFLPPILPVLVKIVFLANEISGKSCLVKDQKLLIIDIIYYAIVYIIMIVICASLIIGLCKVETRKDSEIKRLKKSIKN